jgi:hypothetical protein
MKCIVRGNLVLEMPSMADEEEAKRKMRPPAEQFKALQTEDEFASNDLVHDKTEELKVAGIASVDRFPMRFLEQTQKYPNDTIAAHALAEVVWAEGNAPHPVVGSESPGAWAGAILLPDHVVDANIGPACQRLSSGFRKECETFLLKVLETNPLSQSGDHKNRFAHELEEFPELQHDLEAGR